MDPKSPNTAVHSIKIFEVTYQLRAFDEQTAELLSTTDHVNLNVQEARRLRGLKNGILNDGERFWIDNVIVNTVSALQAVARLLELARVDKATEKGITFVNKMMWVLRDHQKIRDKHNRLVMCHQSLTAVISCLYAKEAVILTPSVEERDQEQPPPYIPQIEDFLIWQHQRRRRKMYKNIKEGGIAIKPALASSSSTSALLPAESNLDTTTTTSLAPFELDAELHLYSVRHTKHRPTKIIEALGRLNDPNCKSLQNLPKPNTDSHDTHLLDYWSRLNSCNIVTSKDIDLMESYIKSTTPVVELEGCSTDIIVHHDGSSSCSLESQSAGLREAETGECTEGRQPATGITMTTVSPPGIYASAATSSTKEHSPISALVRRSSVSQVRYEYSQMALVSTNKSPEQKEPSPSVSTYDLTPSPSIQASSSSEPTTSRSTPSGDNQSTPVERISSRRKRYEWLASRATER